MTARHVPLGVGAPLHDYFEQISNWFEVAPIQLSPNSYRLAAALYILYHEEHSMAPSMRELSYFFRLTPCGEGYYFLVVHRNHNKRGFSEGRTSHVKKWKESYFYAYNIKRTRTQFNTVALKHPMTELEGDELIRAEHILNLPAEKKNLSILVTEAIASVTNIERFFFSAGRFKMCSALISSSPSSSVIGCLRATVLNCVLVLFIL